MLPAAKEKLPDGKDGGADKDGDGDKMEGKCFIHHRTLSRIVRKCGLKYRLCIYRLVV